MERETLKYNICLPFSILVLLKNYVGYSYENEILFI